MKREGRVSKLVLVLMAAVGLMGLMFPPGVRAETLNEKEARLADLQRQSQEYQRKLNATKQQVGDLQGVIGDIDSNISLTEAKISNTEDQIGVTEDIITELNANIQQTESQLASLQTRLDSAYVGLYELSQTSTADSILSSGSLSDIVSQAQYIQVLQSDLQSNIRVANDLRAQLETKKADSVAQKASLDGLKNDLVQSNTALNNQRNQKNYLLVQTQGQQAQYESLLKKLEQQKETVSAEIYALRVGLGGAFSDGGSGGYPYASFDPNGVDPWLYYFRQCTSYAAWKFLIVYGAPFYNTRPGQGSAWNWPALAADQGYHTSSTPHANVVVSWSRSPSSPIYGHAAWVKAVNSDGTIDVSEYNFRVPLGYGERYHINPTDPRFGTPTYIFP